MTSTTEPPSPLVWLYMLVAVGLLSIGVAAGNLFFFGQRFLSFPYAQALTRCTRAHPWQPEGSTLPDGSALAGFNACMEAPARVHGLVMLGGAGLLLAGAAVLMVLVPLADQRRIHRHRGRFGVPGAQARFAELCDQHHLTGRRRPRLLVAGPPVRQAFTTALPGRRPAVVLPAAVALAHTDPDRFDPVVHHELAHVLARDVTWVSAVRGLVWLTVPVVVAASMPEIVTVGATVIPRTAFVQSVLLVAVTAALAAGLLRLREREADLHAARAGSADALVALFTKVTKVTKVPGTGAPRRLLARHPDPAARIAALRDLDRPREGGLVQGLVTGLVTVTAMGAASTLTAALNLPSQASLAPAVAGCVGGIVLGCGLTPSLFRRATAARRTGLPARWWRPVTGVAAGLVAGAFLSPVLPLPGATSFPLPTPHAGINLLHALMTAVAGAGAVTLCASLARLLADTQLAGTQLADTQPPPGRAGRLPRWATCGAAAATTVAAFWPLPAIASMVTHPTDLTDLTDLRAWLVFALPRSPWPLLAVTLPLATAALLYRPRLCLPRGTWRSRPTRELPARELTAPAHTAAAAAVLGGGIAAVHTQLAAPATLDQALRLAQERWWVCALTGWAVLVVIVTRRGHRSLPHAVIASWTAAVTAGGMQYLHALLTGRSSDLVSFRLHVVTPVIWLIYLTVLTAPVLSLLVSLHRSLRSGSRPGPRDPATAAHPRRGARHWARHWAAPLAGALPAAALAVLVIGPGIPDAYAPVARAASADPGTAPPGPPTSSPPPRPTSPATGGTGRVLTSAEAQVVAGAVRPVLPSFWHPERVSGQQDRSTIDPSDCRPLAHDEYLQVLKPHERASATAHYATDASPVGIVSTSLEVDVTSYAAPVPASVFAAAETARARCPRFRGTSASGFTVTFQVTTRPAPALGEATWRADYQMSAGSGASRITGTTAFAMVRLGHNLVAVSMTAVMEPLDEALFQRALARAVQALTPLLQPAAPRG